MEQVVLELDFEGEVEIFHIGKKTKSCISGSRSEWELDTCSLQAFGADVWMLWASTKM